VSAVVIEVLGEKEVAIRLNRAMVAASNGDMLERALVAGALLPLNTAKRLAPYRTGNLRRSLHVGGHSASPEGGDIGGNVNGPGFAEILAGTNLEYAPDVECGTSAHEIRPVNKKALYWPGANHPVAVVHHPGTAPQPYLRPAFDGSAPIIAAEMGRVLEAAIKAALG